MLRTAVIDFDLKRAQGTLGPKLRSIGLNPVFFADANPGRVGRLPRDLDLVVLVTTAMGHSAQDAYMEECRRRSVRVVRIQHKWSSALRVLTAVLGEERTRLPRCSTVGEALGVLEEAHGKPLASLTDLSRSAAGNPGTLGALLLEVGGHLPTQYAHVLERPGKPVPFVDAATAETLLWCWATRTVREDAWSAASAAMEEHFGRKLDQPTVGPAAGEQGPVAEPAQEAAQMDQEAAQMDQSDAPMAGARRCYGAPANEQADKPFDELVAAREIVAAEGVNTDVLNAVLACGPQPAGHEQVLLAGMAISKAAATSHHAQESRFFATEATTLYQELLAQAETGHAWISLGHSTSELGLSVGRLHSHAKTHDLPKRVVHTGPKTTVTLYPRSAAEELAGSTRQYVYKRPVAHAAQEQPAAPREPTREPLPATTVPSVGPDEQARAAPQPETEFGGNFAVLVMKDGVHVHTHQLSAGEAADWQETVSAKILAGLWPDDHDYTLCRMGATVRAKVVRRVDFS